MLGGGNDGLNAFAPISGTDRSRYQTLRGGLAIPAAQLLPAAEGYGFHPRLTKLRARYAAGRVAVVRGVGQPTNDLSHFTSMATFMAGTASTARSSGWLGRYLDGVTEFDSGMRGITFSSSVPLHLLGQRAKVTAVPDQGGMWGSDPTERVRARRLRGRAGATPTRPPGSSAWGDRVAANGKAAIGMAQTINTLYHPDLDGHRPRPRPHPRRPTGQRQPRHPGDRRQRRRLGHPLATSSTTTASSSASSMPASKPSSPPSPPASATRPRWRPSPSSGAGPRRNDSVGTDHGTASVMFVVGENVRGRPARRAAVAHRVRRSAATSCPTVDFRSVYATLLDRWLDGDPAARARRHVRAARPLHQRPRGSSHPSRSPAAAQPGQALPGLDRPRAPAVRRPPAHEPRRRRRWRPGSAASSAATTTPVDMIVAFIGSTASVQQVQPVLRAHWACFGRVPTYDQLALLGRRSAARPGIAKVCDAMVATASFRAQNGTLDNTAFAKWLYRATLGPRPRRASTRTGPAS